MIATLCYLAFITCLCACEMVFLKIRKEMLFYFYSEMNIDSKCVMHVLQNYGTQEPRQALLHFAPTSLRTCSVNK